MSGRNPIMITGAAGAIGSVSRDMIGMLLEQGHPVRAFVRRDDVEQEHGRQANW